MEEIHEVFLTAHADKGTTPKQVVELVLTSTATTSDGDLPKPEVSTLRRKLSAKGFRWTAELDVRLWAYLHLQAPSGPTGVRALHELCLRIQAAGLSELEELEEFFETIEGTTFEAREAAAEVQNMLMFSAPWTL